MINYFCYANVMLLQANFMIEVTHDNFMFASQGILMVSIKCAAMFMSDEYMQDLIVYLRQGFDVKPQEEGRHGDDDEEEEERAQSKESKDESLICITSSV